MKEVQSLSDLAARATGASARVLAHICCGPCSVAPLRKMLAGAAELWGYFHNPNIHPYSEFKKRLAAVKELARVLSLPVIYDEDYRPSAFMKGVRLHTGAATGMPPAGPRCRYCYAERIEATALAASLRGFEYFTTSLLYSNSQDHAAIKAAGVESARKYGIIFLYEDFRKLWDDGLDASKELGLYRQRYCGCVYSMIERGWPKPPTRP